MCEFWHGTRDPGRITQPGSGEIVPALAAGTGSAERHRPGRRLVATPGHRAAAGLAPLAELNVANGFPAFITRTADAQGYRDRFAALIGPVTGPEYR